MTTPRVRLTDPAGGSERPFIIGVLADLGGTQPFPGGGFRPIRRADFDAVLRQIGPRLRLQLMADDQLVNLELHVGGMTGFTPAEVARQVPEHLLSAVLRHPDFLRLEGAWRGLHYLVEQAAPDDVLQVVALDARGGDLAGDAAADGDGRLFELVAGDGGGPCGLLVADYELDVRRADAVELLRGLAEVGASVHAPVVAAAAPAAFGLDSWADAARLRDPEKELQSVEFAAWRSFRESPESRFVALALPRVLARAGAGDAVDADARTGTCWMSAAWAYAAVAARAFREYGWFARTRGADDGSVPGLPPPQVYLGRPPVLEGDAKECEIALDRLGFLPVVRQTGTDRAAFFGTQSCHKPPAYFDAGQTARAAASARLDVLLCVGRFVQAVTDTAQGLTKAELSRRLTAWLAGYAGATAEKPLGRAEVELESGPKGATTAVLRLRLDYQFDKPVEVSVGVPVTVRG